MNYRIPLIAAATGGGLLTTAFLQAVVAAADEGSGNAADLSDSAFTVSDGTTFDPGSDGFEPVTPSLDAAPFLGFGSGTQGLNVVGDGDAAGSVSTDVDTSTIFGAQTAQFTVSAAHVGTADIESALTGEDAIGDRDAGYLASLLGGSDGIDFGDGEITAGDVQDALGGDGGAGGGGTGGAVEASDIASALRDAGMTDGDVDGGDQDVDSLAAALADSDLDFNGDINGADIIDALSGTEVADDLDIEDGDFKIDGFTANDVGGALNDNLDIDGGDGDAGGAIDAAAVQGALSASDTDFSDVDLATTLAGSDLDFASGNITADDVSEALRGTPVGDDVLDIESDGSFDDVDFTPADIAQALNNMDVDGDVDASDIESALTASDTDFTSGDLAAILAGLDFTDGDITADEIIDALHGTAVGDAVDIEHGGFSDVDFSPDDLAAALNHNLDFDGGDGGDGGAGAVDAGSIADILNDLAADKAGDLPADGSVYSITDLTGGLPGLEDLLGGAVYNVYEAMPDGDITDTLVTPMGTFDLFNPFGSAPDLTSDDVAGLFDSGLFDGGLFDEGGLGDTVDPAAWLG